MGSKGLNRGIMKKQCPICSHSMKEESFVRHFVENRCPAFLSLSEPLYGKDWRQELVKRGYRVYKTTENKYVIELKDKMS